MAANDTPDLLAPGLPAPDLPTQARALLRGARVATLATSDAGQPFASLVTPAIAIDGSVLLLLSSLSAHTAHLAAEPRCALLVAGAPVEANPQTAPRATLVGTAQRCADAALRARWLALHPYATFYAGFADFGLWRITPSAGQIVAGFGRARQLSAAELCPAPQAAAALAAAEPGILAALNAGPLRQAAGEAAGLAGGVAQFVAIDPMGCDLAAADQVARLDFAAMVADAAGFHQELARRLGS